MKNKPRTWILLRGLAREKGHWGTFPEAFAAHFSHDKVVCVDLPGAGEFRNQTSPRDMAGIFQFVRARAIERTKAGTQFSVVSVSLGGMVALEWLRQKPDDLAGCVLINSSSKTLSPFFNRLRWQIWQKFLKVAAIQSPRERETCIAEMVINSVTAREQAVPLWSRLAVEHPIRYINFFNQLLAASRYGAIPDALGIPMLLLCGLGDRLVDPSCSFLLSEKTNWPLKSHPWGGHDLTWDDPEWVIQQIHAWNEASAYSLDGKPVTSTKI